MIGYRIYNDEAQLRGLIADPFGLYIFLNQDVDQPVLSDPAVRSWAALLGLGITIYPDVWSREAGVARGRSTCPHPLVVDSADSSILMIRDIWTAQRFNDSTRLSDCPR